MSTRSAVRGRGHQSREFSHLFAGVAEHGDPDFFQLGAITSTEPLGPFLVDGQLQLQPRLLSLDGMKAEM